ncbi:MAG: hypothetical protein ACFFG0_15575 [Candidatus Thorarchaeota archaeon]
MQDCVPKHFKKARKRKFGIKYKFLSDYFIRALKISGFTTRWYKTEKHRDDALKALIKREPNKEFKKINR